jgi:hypothetical protein
VINSQLPHDLLFIFLRADLLVERRYVGSYAVDFLVQNRLPSSPIQQPPAGDRLILLRHHDLLVEFDRARYLLVSCNSDLNHRNAKTTIRCRLMVAKSIDIVEKTFPFNLCDCK